MKAILFLLSLFVVAFGFGSNCPKGPVINNTNIEAAPMPSNLKVVFFGDQGLGSNPVSVLKAIKTWNPQFIVHVGDYDYVNDPAAFEKQLDDVLGPNYPYFAAIGNHDIVKWTGTTGYQQRLINRLKRFGGDKNCTGEYGVNFACNYYGLLFVVSGVGTRGSNHAAFIDDTFSSTAATWKVCNWHKNQHLYQTGEKTDETGYQVYDTCRKHGAIVSTGHEHSFERTHLMSDYATQKIASKDALLSLEQGKSFCWVAGLGGVGIRDWKDNLEKNAWWAKTASSDNGVGYGAMYCTFNINGNINDARCFFQDVKNKVWDDFQIKSKLSSTVPTPRANCPKDFIEIPVVSSGQEYAQLRHLDGHIYLANANMKSTFSTFQFNGVSIKSFSEVQNIHLEFYGAELGSSATINITAQVGSKVTKSVFWDLQDAEVHDVWTTPNLKDIVEEAMSAPEWKDGSSVTFLLEGSGHTAIYSYRTSPCVAPTMFVQLNRPCL